MTASRRLGKYEILGEIGRGGFAVVYKARDTTLNRVVALKVLHPQLTIDPKFVQRFQQEAQTAARLHHPHIVTIHEVGEEGGQHYLAMAFLPGRTLDERLSATRGPLPLELAISITEQIADALDTIHQQGLVHRDVKPANVMVGGKGWATLLDFGIVRAAEGTRLTTTMAILGTPEYMAPEQADPAEEKEIDWRGDVYALGVVAYEMLVGQPPFTGKSPTKVLYQHVHEPPPEPTTLNPDLPAGLEPVLLKALAKEREERFQRAGDFAATLRRTLLTESEIRRREAQLTPLYQQLQAAAAGENWLEVLALGSQIQTLDPSYRDVPQRMAHARQQLRYPRREPSQPPPAQPAKTPKRGISRRRFLQGALIAGGSVVGCGAVAGVAALVASQDWLSCEGPPVEEPTRMPTPTDTPTPTVDTPVPPSAYNEAPMLTEMVEAGEIPPVDERLPKNPWVYPPNDGIGNYGGYMRRGFKGISDRWGCRKLCDRKLVTYTPDLQVIPRLAESWELSDDAKTWTWYLREGTKWSDGVDFTSADYMWHYENYMSNKELNPTFNTGWSTMGSDGEWNPVVFEALDDYTIVMKFEEPNPLFHIVHCARDWENPVCPHFMKKFHMDLTDDKEALEQMIAEEGVESWTDIFKNRMAPGESRGEHSPSLYPWVPVNTMHDEVYVMERNPYFYGVDPEGNQLPYLDQVQFRLFDSQEVLNVRVVSGEIDFQGRHMTMADYTLYKDSEEAGDYKVFLAKKSGHVAMQVNHTCKDPNLREFFQNRYVRIALSYACNREELNELVYNGLYTPRQYSPLKASPDYHEELSNAYIEYDPDKAKELLAEAGYVDTDGDGYCEFKDGSPLSFVIESTASSGSVDEDAVALYIQHLANVGIKAQHNAVARSLYTEHFQANDIEAAWWGGDRTVIPLAAPIIFIGIQPDRPWCPAWGYYRTDPTNPVAEEPPEGHWIWEIWRIWDEEIAIQPDEEKQHEAFRKILDIWAEELPYIGLLGEQPAPVIVKNGFRGYLEGYPLDDVTSDEHLLQTETYYWEDPEEHSL